MSGDIRGGSFRGARPRLRAKSQRLDRGDNPARARSPGHERRCVRACVSSPASASTAEKTTPSYSCAGLFFTSPSLVRIPSACDANPHRRADKSPHDTANNLVRPAAALPESQSCQRPARCRSQCPNHTIVPGTTKTKVGPMIQPAATGTAQCSTAQTTAEHSAKISVQAVTNSQRSG